MGTTPPPSPWPVPRPSTWPPEPIAQIIVDHLELEGSLFPERPRSPAPASSTSAWAAAGTARSSRTSSGRAWRYGAVDEGRGEKVMVEFVSANPTGPMHIGNARGGVLGDSLASVLERAGYDVWREFYVNDAGNQIHKFAVSIDTRYRQLILGEENVPFPEDCYQGDDIKELAAAFRAEHGDSWVDKSEEERQEAMANFGLKRNIPKMQEDLRRYKIEYNEWFLESTLHNSGYVAETVGMLSDKGWTYEKDGALWLNTTELLKEKYMREGKTREQVDKLDLKDDVLRRANGFYTYFAADIAYHRNKLEKRGFQTAINIWGADHHDRHVARLQAALDGLGLDGSHRLVVVLMQLVNLLQDGKPVRMSKRSGKAIALRDLLDEVSVDACRYFFNSRSFTSPLDFDLDLAVKEDSDNPVYYVQYAHARICSLVARMKEEGPACPLPPPSTPPCSPPLRSWPWSRPFPSSPRRSVWPAGTTIPPTSTATCSPWPATSTGSTTPAASRARRSTSWPPGSSWRTPSALCWPTAWRLSASPPLRRCNSCLQHTPAHPSGGVFCQSHSTWV